LFINSGRTTAEILIDTAGTPTDPSDDQELSFQVLTNRTGRNDLLSRDYCDDIHEFIG